MCKTDSVMHHCMANHFLCSCVYLWSRLYEPWVCNKLLLLYTIIMYITHMMVSKQLEKSWGMYRWTCTYVGEVSNSSNRGREQHNNHYITEQRHVARANQTNPEEVIQLPMDHRQSSTTDACMSHWAHRIAKWGWRSKEQKLRLKNCKNTMTSLINNYNFQPVTIETTDVSFSFLSGLAK